MKNEWEKKVRSQCQLLVDNGKPDHIDFSEALTNGMVEIIEDCLLSQKQRAMEMIPGSKDEHSGHDQFAIGFNTAVSDMIKKIMEL